MVIAGFVRSLARPGGNVTGVSLRFEIDGKRVLGLSRDLLRGVPALKTATSTPRARGCFEPLIVRPERYGEPSRFDTTPSQPSVQACSLINIGVILLLLLFDDQTTKIAAPPVAPRA